MFDVRINAHLFLIDSIPSLEFFIFSASFAFTPSLCLFILMIVRHESEKWNFVCYGISLDWMVETKLLLTEYNFLREHFHVSMMLEMDEVTCYVWHIVRIKNIWIVLKGPIYTNYYTYRIPNKQTYQRHRSHKWKMRIPKSGTTVMA